MLALGFSAATRSPECRIIQARCYSSILIFWGNVFLPVRISTEHPENIWQLFTGAYFNFSWKFCVSSKEGNPGVKR